MKYTIYIFLFLLMGMTVRAQLPSSTFPSRIFNGNTKAQWILLDSPVVNPILDTFNARYPGTQLVRIQGGDTAFWFGAGGHLWFRSLLIRDTISLSDRINLKLNITDTANKWWGIGKRWVDTVYRVNDSTIGYTINGSPYTFEIKGGAQGGGGGAGTVTSVGLSMPSAFSVTGSPITSSGTFNVSGAGTSADYIRGNGTLAVTDTGMIPNFHLKVRSLFSGTSPLTYNSTTGLFGVLRANTSGQLGVASFNNSDFVDNGAGLISLRSPGGGAGVDTVFRTPGVDSIYFTINGTQYAIKDSSGMVIYANDGLSKNGDTVQLGQTVSAVGNPAALSSTREIPLNGFNAVFTGTGGLGIGTSTVGNRKLNISATSTTQGVNITTVDGIGINVVASGNGHALFAQTAGTGNALTGSNAGSSGYGVLAVNSNNNVVPLKSNVFSTLTNSSTPVVTEFTRNVFGIPADGVGLTVMFRGQTTVSTDVESGQIRNYWSTVLHSGRSSAFEFHLVNNTVSGRKALLASTGQWTWDGYPGLTAQADTATYKPIGIDGSGNVVKMAGWAGSGGGGASLTATQVAFGSGTNTITSEAAFNYIASSNYLTVDTVRAKKVRIDTALFYQSTLTPSGSRLAGFMDSYTSGTAASPILDSAYIYLGGNYYELPVDNYAITGSGSIQATYQHYLNINYPNQSVTSMMVGLNTLRIGGGTAKTYQRITQAYKAIFCNHFSKTFYPASDNTHVTRHGGGWTTGWASSSGGGKAGTQGAFTANANDSIKFSFTDSTVWFSVIAGDGSGSIYTSPDVDVYIDNVFVENYNFNNQTDGQADGSFDGRLTPVARYYTGLTYGAHVIKIVNKANLYLLFDGFGTLVDKSIATTYVMWHVPKMLDPAGYATAPANSSDAITNTMNGKLDSLKATFPIWYPVYIVPVNNYYFPNSGDVTAGVDDVHPNNQGHRHIFDALVATLGSPASSLENGVVIRSNDALYLKKETGLEKIITGDVVYNQGQIIFDDSMRVGALNAKAVAIISNGRTLASFVDGPNVGEYFGNVRTTGNLQAENGGLVIGGNTTFQTGVGWKLGAYNTNPALLMNTSVGATNGKFWMLQGINNAFYLSAWDDAGASFNNFLEVRRNGITIDTVTFPHGKIYIGEMTRTTAPDSVLTWDLTSKQVRLAPSGAGSVTTLYTGDGTLPATRSVSGAGNSLNLGLIGSQLGLFSIYSNSRTVLNSGITYGTDATNTDANYTVPANKIIAELTDVPLSTGRTLTLPTAATNGQTVTLVMRYSAGSNKYSLSSAVTDNATGTTFTQLDWGVTYDFMVDQALAWRLIRKY